MLGLTRCLVSRSAVISRRTIMTSSSLRGDARSLCKLKQMQSDYQAEDGRPIFLKAGFRDRVIYSTTLVLCAFGILGVLNVIYDQAKPPSWRTPAC